MNLHTQLRLSLLFIGHLLLSGHLLSGHVAAQTPDWDDLGQSGPYQVAYYSQLPPVPEFSAATLYFPANKAQDFAGVVIAPGFIEKQINIQWWGYHLASHGFAVLTLDTNDVQERPPLRAAALMAGVAMLKAENSRMGGMLRGKILEDRMALMGHSMGGGGTLLAANEYSEALRAAIPFTPWLPNGDVSSVSVPTLVLAGEIDRIASNDQHAWPLYQGLTSAAPRMYLEVAGGNHFIANTLTENVGLNPNIDVHDLVGGMAVAWLKLFLDGDESYRDLVFGDLPQSDRERLSRWEFVE